MSEAPRSRDLKDLLTHAAWLRRFASHLVSDEAAADDIAQESWISIARHLPEAGRPPRGWLATVVRNVARMQMRQDSRRRAREIAATDGESNEAPSTDVLMARIQMQRTLAELVMGLDEPFRSTVLLRYYEDLTATEIGRLHHVAPGTVRWRLKIALDRVRHALDERSGGDRRSWILAIGAVGRAGLVVKGAFVVKKLTMAVAVLLALLGLGSIAWRAGHADRPSAENAKFAVQRPPTPFVGGATSGVRSATLDVHVQLAGGAPAPGAYVTVVRSGLPKATTELPILVAVTDGGGIARLAGLTPGRYVVAASSSRPGIGPSVLCPVTLAAGGTGSVMLSLADTGYVVVGRILDEEAGPVTTARITALRADGAVEGVLPRYSVAVDAQGSYSITLAPGQYSLFADADGYSRGRAALTLGADATQNFTLAPDAQLVGRVIDGITHEPVPGAEVRVYPVIMTGYWHPPVFTDADGTFRVPKLEAAEWVAQAREGRRIGKARPALVRSGRATGGLEIAIYDAPIVTGRIQSPDARSLAGASVSAGLRVSRVSVGGVVADDGTFRIKGVPAGSYEVHAATPGGVQGWAPLLVADRDVQGIEIKLVLPIRVYGRVLDQNGIPMPSARVTVRTAATSPDSEWPRGSRIVVADASGAFQADGLQPGALTVIAESEGVGVALWGPENVGGGEARRVEVRLAQGGTLVGTVRDGGGRLAAGVNVYVLNPNINAGRLSRTTSGGDGRYSVPHVLPGEIRVEATRSDARPFGALSKLLVVAAEGETPQDLVVAETTTLRGRVVVSDGKAAVGAAVLASSSPDRPGPNHPRRGSTDLHGSFTFPGVDVGTTYHVWADLPDAHGRASALAGTQDLVVTISTAP